MLSLHVLAKHSEAGELVAHCVDGWTNDYKTGHSMTLTAVNEANSNKWDSAKYLALKSMITLKNAETWTKHAEDVANTLPTEAMKFGTMHLIQKPKQKITEALGCARVVQDSVEQKKAPQAACLLLEDLSKTEPPTRAIDDTTKACMEESSQQHAEGKRLLEDAIKEGSSQNWVTAKTLAWKSIMTLENAATWAKCAGEDMNNQCATQAKLVLRNVEDKKKSAKPQCLTNGENQQSNITTEGVLVGVLVGFVCGIVVTVIWNRAHKPKTSNFLQNE